MERESFQDPSIAALLNAHFVNIKVDREERPDLDAVYMQAVSLLTGHAGWPLSVWLTPEGAPFYGGTYFPPTSRFGLPSFRQVVTGVATLWREQRGDILRAARELTAQLERQAQHQASLSLRQQILASSLEILRTSFDAQNGGWGGAPKFPAPLVLDYLLAQLALGATPDVAPELKRVADLTLEAMARGGIYDHLGGGFHRYSTDEAWLVPHFEKMLYDNAQLVRSYLHAWQLTGRPLYRQVVEETLDYLLGRLRHPQGAFFSAEDADSEGKEGAYYLWSMDELTRLLTPEELALAARVFGLTPHGHFAGGNILHLPAGLPGHAETGDQAQLKEIKAKLLVAREGRPHPRRDEKILAGWNGLAIAALAEAGRVFGAERYTTAAETAADFLLKNLLRQEQLVHSWTEGRLSRARNAI